MLGVLQSCWQWGPSLQASHTLLLTGCCSAGNFAGFVHPLGRANTCTAVGSVFSAPQILQVIASAVMEFATLQQLLGCR